jgi:hypothetical protein
MCYQYKTTDLIRNENHFLIYNVDSWLRHYAISRKVVGVGPDDVDFFNLPNPSSRTMALGPTQPLTEMSTRNLPGG